MMLSLLLAVAAQDASPPPSEDEIVVIAKKMRFIEVDMKVPRRKGRLVLERCRVTAPSGYAELDGIPCVVAQECISESPATRRLLQACVEERSQPRFDAVIAGWRARR